MTPLQEEVTATETGDNNTPTEVTLGFSITRANPEVEVENITWTYTLLNHNGTTLDTAELEGNSAKYNFSADYRMLTIFNITFFDAGSITLSASNEIGTSNSTLQLIIHGKHRIHHSFNVSRKVRLKSSFE